MPKRTLSPKSAAISGKTYVIIPLYNKGGAIRAVLKDLAKDFDHIICINDGSTDDSAEQANQRKIIVIEHAFNLGQGAALQTGIDFALQDPEAQYFITFDADGQHDKKDALKMLAYIQAHPVDIVLGSRFLGTAKNSSTFKRLFLKVAITFTNKTTGLKLTDTHNGLRVFNRKVAEQLKLTMPDFAHASEIVQRIADMKFIYKELPVTIHYTDYSKAHGQSVFNSVNIVFDVLLNKVSGK